MGSDRVRSLVNSLLPVQELAIQNERLRADATDADGKTDTADPTTTATDKEPHQDRCGRARQRNDDEQADRARQARPARPRRIRGAGGRVVPGRQTVRVAAPQEAGQPLSAAPAALGRITWPPPRCRIHDDHANRHKIICTPQPVVRDTLVDHRPRPPPMKCTTRRSKAPDLLLANRFGSECRIGGALWLRTRIAANAGRSRSLPENYPIHRGARSRHLDRHAPASLPGTHDKRGPHGP
jgi:hypothetical protein